MDAICYICNIKTTEVCSRCKKWTCKQHLLLKKTR